MNLQTSLGSSFQIEEENKIKGGIRREEEVFVSPPPAKLYTFDSSETNIIE